MAASNEPPRGPSPSQPAGSERRIASRTPITLRVDYKRINTFFADYTKNISKGGTFIRTPKPLAIGTEFVFVLNLPPKSDGEPRRLALRGVVRWVVDEGRATEEDPAGMGLEFRFDDAKDRQEIEGFVGKLMSESLGDDLSKKLLKK